MNAYNDFLKHIQPLNIKILEREPLDRHTSFKIGGPADLLILPEDEPGLAGVLAACREGNVPCFLMGNGSNLLVGDEGFRGAVIKLADNFGGIELQQDGATIKARAGTMLSKLCLFAMQKGLSGLEFAYGIPGTVGGAAYMNAGAYGGEMKHVLTSARYLDKDGRAGGLLAEQMELDYRRSAFCHNGYIITEVTLRLTPADKNQIKQKMDELLGRRREKQPLNYPSAGSTFKRPPGNFAGGLIEQCGLKGAFVGGAQVSEKHAGFVVNRGNATCKDVRELIEKIQTVVREKTGVSLECEIKFL